MIQRKLLSFRDYRSFEGTLEKDKSKYGEDSEYMNAVWKTNGKQQTIKASESIERRAMVNVNVCR